MGRSISRSRGELIEAQIELGRPREETITLIKRRFSLSSSEAESAYERHIARNDAIHSRYLIAVLISGLISVIGLVLIAILSDRFTINVPIVVITAIPALSYLPFIAFLVLRRRSRRQDVAGSARIIAVNTLAVWAFLLDIWFAFALFEILVGFE